MRRRSALILGICSLVLLTGCATGTGDSMAEIPVLTVEPEESDTIEVVSEHTAAAARQAQEWLDAAVVPPGAVFTPKSPANFNSYQWWPCQPAVEFEGYWTLEGMTIGQATNWLRDNPTADLVSTAVGPPFAEDFDLSETLVGHIPVDESQQGIVYTVVKIDGGVAIRAEVAALTESAVCPSLEPGTMLGKPGQG